MRQIAILAFLAMGLVPSVSHADVELVAKNPSITDGNEVMVAEYDRKIDKLNQTSDEISASLFSKKSAVKSDSQDGMKVALVKRN